MSSDLWAAFDNGGDALSNPWSQPSPKEERTQPHPSRSISQESKQESFLVDTQDNQVPPAAQSIWDNKLAFSPAYGSNSTNSLNNTAWSDHADMGEGWSDFVSPGQARDPWATSKPLQKLEILWDVDEAIKEDDEFGDFEAPVSGAPSGILNSNFSDQALVSASSHQEVHNSSLNPSVLQTKSRDHLKITQRVPNDIDTTTELKITDDSNNKVSTTRLKVKQQSLSVKSPLEYPDEVWDEWSPGPTSRTYPKSKPASKAVSDQPTYNPDKSAARTNVVPSTGPNTPSLGAQSSSSSTSNLPPTNIPPPSILISLLSSLVSTLPAQVEAAMESFTSSAASSAAADKALSTAVHKCLAALRVAARIVAGRKVRWKRDTHLGQSMRIGPAAGSGKSGMKLTGVDRNEARREDREVAEFVGVWQNRLGSVRRALASVNSKIGESSSRTDATGKKLELPIISEVMLIRTIKEEDGGVKSAKACALCGIKREERVDKVDIDVFDGFGEWWTDYWGHKECRAFWYQHEKYLQQR